MKALSRVPNRPLAEVCDDFRLGRDILSLAPTFAMQGRGVCATMGSVTWRGQWKRQRESVLDG
ncbi:protein of unknown function [Candidatus Methylocalor cossyra]|uniref:Uncharacterized protein n=1 Tax=Candidatus Methylocalor cossyra TaxID=3108543 RepID=A0ABM9NJ75_9GAMM